MYFSKVFFWYHGVYFSFVWFYWLVIVIWNIVLVGPIWITLFLLFSLFVCYFHCLHPSSMRCRGSNTRPLDHELSALTTRPWLLANWLVIVWFQLWVIVNEVNKTLGFIRKLMLGGLYDCLQIWWVRAVFLNIYLYAEPLGAQKNLAEPLRPSFSFCGTPLLDYFC